MQTIIRLEKLIRVIWKCRNAKCKKIWAFDYTLDEFKHEYRMLADGTRRYLRDDHLNQLRCPDCNCNLPRATKVEGRYSEKAKCNSQCTGARGPRCDCQCAGRNHGAGFLI